MQYFKNTSFVKRDYECSNIVACLADKAPAENFAPSDETVINGLTQIWIENGVRYYGYL
jgi:hypothetical protein